MSLRNFINAIFVFVLVAFSVSDLHAVEHNSSSKLDRYIQKHCKSGCIDGDVLLFGVSSVAKEVGVNPVTLLAIMKVESNFKPRATNTKSGRSLGLMQIQVYWHKAKFKTNDYYAYMDNIRVGALVYKDCVKKYKGSREKALWCYNGHQEAGMKTYVKKVITAFNEISQLDLRFG